MFFLWTASHGWILTLDNLMLRGCPLTTWCCMCCCDGESVHYLLLHCPVTHSLWTFMLQAFGIHWVMPGSVEGLLSCWHQWLGKHNLDIWNLVPRCLMWIVWLEWNHRSFEDIEKTLDELKVLCQWSLLEWSCCWGFTNCSSITEVMLSLSLVSWFLLLLCCLFYIFLLFIIMNNLYFSFFLINNSFLITYPKNKKRFVLGNQ